MLNMEPDVICSQKDCPNKIRLEEKMLRCPILLPSSFKDSLIDFNWTFTNLAKVLENKIFSCRLFPKTCARTMETECVHEEVTIHEFQAWLDEDSSDSANPLKNYPRSKYAGYIDYKYMKDMFAEHPEVLNKVQWKDFGLEEFDGSHSTIWLGTDGANTPGHQDSYGFNLVSQLSGRKLWILFPPEDSQCLYPTRLPYEESSVFSEVNIRKPDLKRHPLLKNSHPYIVVLHPGQTLYVPHHWWHYVESLDSSISINVWVPMACDDQNRLHEAVTRCLATSLIQELGEGMGTYEKWLNPTEDLFPPDVTVKMLRSAAKVVIESSDDLSAETQQIDEQSTDDPSSDGENKMSSKDSEPKEKHLSSFYQKIKLCFVKNVKCSHSFYSETSSKKRKHSGGMDLNSKNLKSNTCENVKANHLPDLSEIYVESVDTNRTSLSSGSSSEQNSSTGNETHPCLFTFSPCSFKDYIKFLDSLCKSQQCHTCHPQDLDISCSSNNETSSCIFSKGLKRHSKTDVTDTGTRVVNERSLESNTDTVHSKVETEQYQHALSYTNVLSQNVEEDHSHSEKRGHGEKIVITDTEIVISQAPFEQESKESRESRISANCDTSLSAADINDCFLNSVLHPDVICKIQEIFLEKCRQKIKEKT